MELVSPVPHPSDSLHTVKNPSPETAAQKEMPTIPRPESSPAVAGESLPLPGHKEELLYTIDTELYRAQLSSKHGGSLVSFETFNYTGQDSAFLNLIEGINGQNMVIRYKNIDGQDVDLSAPWSPGGNHFSGALTSPTPFASHPSLLTLSLRPLALHRLERMLWSSSCAQDTTSRPSSGGTTSLSPPKP